MRNGSFLVIAEVPVSESISGLCYVPFYISAKECDLLREAIDQNPWLTDLKRRVQHYGYKYDYKAKTVARDSYLGPLPDWSAALAERLVKDRLTPQRFDQLIVNEYVPGQGISKHIDCPACFEDTIISVSLGSGCIMEFKQPKLGLNSSLYLDHRRGP